MSNHLAVATVTATLRRHLQAALDSDAPPVANAKVTAARPSANPSELPSPGVNIFLYLVSSNRHLRNEDLPARRGDGSLLQRPFEALDLHYLLSFHGNDGRLEPQRLLGSTMRLLHAQPLITPPMIQATLADPVFAFLAGSDLAGALEPVRITPGELSLEEITKLWSAFFQTPYVLSVTYRAQVVLIHAPSPAAQQALPVRKVRVGVAAGWPVLERVLSRASATEPARPEMPILPGHILVLEGHGLQGRVTRVRLGPLEVTPPPDTTAPARIALPLPPTLTAGLHTVQVLHRRAAEPSPLDVSSNSESFVLRPVITAAVVGSAVRVGFNPPVRKTQRVALTLNEFRPPANRPARSHRFELPPRSTPDTSAQLDIPFQGVLPGSYLVLVEVDGAESVLAFDAEAGEYSGPRVTIT